MEVWKDIPGYEGLYQASSLGRFRSLPHKRRRREGTNNNAIVLHPGGIINPYMQKRGYLHIRLYNDGKYQSFIAHRVIAKVFIPNPYGYEQVNHKNEIKTDNRVENLEWCTNTYNRNYGSSRDRHKKPVIGIKDGISKTYNSITEAAKDTGLFSTNISNCCKGKYKQTKGYIWHYL